MTQSTYTTVQLVQLHSQLLPWATGLKSLQHKTLKCVSRRLGGASLKTVRAYCLMVDLCLVVLKLRNAFDLTPRRVM